MKVENIIPKNWQGREFAELTLDGKVYSCWSNAWKSLKIGDDIQGEIVDKGPGKTPHIKIGAAGGGGAPKSSGGGNVKAFAASYAKDVAVALIQAGIIKTSTEIDATLHHYYSLFVEKVEL